MELARIHQELQRKIIQLELGPESILNLSELAGHFGVSRTPIKEALILLQGEGLVVRDGSHFLVTPLSLDRIKEITEIRCVLEVQANVWAMDRITHSEMEDLRLLREEIEGLGRDAGRKEMVDLDYRFHRRIFQSARNLQLTQILERLLNHYSRFWLYLRHEINRDTFFIETLEIIKAIESKDEQTIRMATALHIKKSVDEIFSHPLDERNYPQLAGNG